jgi:hypothetical protein
VGIVLRPLVLENGFVEPAPAMRESNAIKGTTEIADSHAMIVFTPTSSASGKRAHFMRAKPPKAESVCCFMPFAETCQFIS